MNNNNSIHYQLERTTREYITNYNSYQQRVKCIQPSQIIVHSASCKQHIENTLEESDWDAC